VRFIAQLESIELYLDIFTSVKSRGFDLQDRIHKLKNCVNSRPKSVFKDQEAVKCLSSLHDKYVIVPADNASNNINPLTIYQRECLKRS
jgi:hypothetical protein